MSKKKRDIAHPMDVFVGRKIKEYRIRSDKSQKALGEEIGLTFQQLQKYESGKNRVSASMLYEISKVLQTPIGQFFSGIDNAFTPIPIGSNFILADGAEAQYVADEDTILECFAKIKDNKTKESIVMLLRNLANSPSLSFQAITKATSDDSE